MGAARGLSLILSLKTHKLHRESERQRRRLPALPGRGSAEHGGELRGHTRGVAEASKPAGRVAGVGCVALAVDPLLRGVGGETTSGLSEADGHAWRSGIPQRTTPVPLSTTRVHEGSRESYLKHNLKSGNLRI